MPSNTCATLCAAKNIYSSLDLGIDIKIFLNNILRYLGPKITIKDLIKYDIEALL